MKSIKATTIIEGPEEVFISNEANNPTTTDKIPDKIAITIICLGLLLMFLAIAAGIKSKPVINSAPIIFIDKAITPANKRVNIKLEIQAAYLQQLTNHNLQLLKIKISK